MRPMMTVHERAKQTGYVMGPNHPRARQMQRDGQMQMPEQGPPGYRQANMEACGACQDFDGNGQCQKFGASVQPDMVCDSFAPAGEEMEEREDEEPAAEGRNPGRSTPPRRNVGAVATQNVGSKLANYPTNVKGSGANGPNVEDRIRSGRRY